MERCVRRQPFPPSRMLPRLCSLEAGSACSRTPVSRPGGGPAKSSRNTGRAGCRPPDNPMAAVVRSVAAPGDTVCVSSSGAQASEWSRHPRHVPTPCDRQIGLRAAMTTAIVSGRGAEGLRASHSGLLSSAETWNIVHDLQREGG
jgi:hypothetical protein